ncbi:pertactin domain protein [Escherichia coli P0304799.3]|nr:pertactin domain protein [Escherichia coli P0304799.3]
MTAMLFMRTDKMQQLIPTDIQSLQAETVHPLLMLSMVVW